MPIKPPDFPGKTSLISDFPGKSNQNSKLVPSIPGFRVLNRIGEGGMGKVFLARDETLDRNVAIKMISEKIGSTEEAKRRFLREAKAMAKLEHANIARIYTFGKYENEFYFVMENIKGESLAQRLKKSGRYPENESLKILKQVILALEAAWDRKIIHRDIKPSNIIVDKKNQIKVIDFGLAKNIEIGEENSFTSTGVVQGTPHYISPEQIKGEPVDFLGDIYSTGIMLYEMLVGECPFSGTPLEVISKHLHSPLASIKEKRPDVPDEVQKLFEWMTQKDPQKRPSSYDKILEFIDSIEKGQVALPGQDIRQPLKKTVPLKSVTIVLGVLLFFIASVIIYALFFSGKKDILPVSGKEKRLVVAVAPFYGPDEDSAKEGLVMGALVEKSIKEKLGEKNVKVIGIKEIKESVQNHETARKIGKEFKSAIVVWGEAFSVRGETEIQPHFTMIPKEKEPKKDLVETKIRKSNLFETSEPDMREKSVQAVVLGAEVPNQIELRKTTARGIGDMILLLAGIHALDRENNAAKALPLFSQVPKSPDSLRYSAYALLQLNKKDEALKILKESILLDPKDARSYALMGDIYMENGKFQHAVKAYKSASKTGRTYTTRRAIYFDKKLFVKETFKSKYYSRSRNYVPGKVFETRYLLACNPISGKVIERYCLPGSAKSFKIQNNSIHIIYDAGKKLSPLEDEIIFSNGKFNRPIFYGKNLTLRTHSYRNGLALAVNFTGGLRATSKLPVAKFTLRKGMLFDDVPTNLKELEKRLRNAIIKDPTQPWHLFILGQTLWAKGQKEDAEKTWLAMVSGTFPSIPYYEYSDMAYIFERFGQEGWADRVYNEALKRRKQFPQSIETVAIIERLVNANFIRQAAKTSRTSRKGKDMERAYLWLERSREITGICLDYGNLAAMLWERYFREHGDIDRANKEAAISKRAKEDPLNLDMTYLYFEYVACAYGIVLFGFLVFSLLTFTAAFKRSEFWDNTGKKGWMWLNLPRWVERLSRSIAILMAAVLLFSSIDDLDWKFFLSIIVFILLLILFLRSRNFSLRIFAASISQSERKVLIVSLVLVLIGTFLSSLAHKYLISIPLRVPWGVTDSLGHSSLVHGIEERLKEKNSYEVRYAAAVMNHMAGNVERASELYKTLPHDPRAQENLAALKKGNLIPPVPLTAKDLFHAYKGVSLDKWFKEYVELFRSIYLFFRITIIIEILSILFSILLLFTFFRIPARKIKELPPPSGKIRQWFARVSFFLIPGMFDIRRGSPFRGWLIISLVSFVLFTGFFEFDFDNPEYSLGIISSWSKDYIYDWFPLPHSLSQGEDLVEFFKWEIFWSHPGAEIFWSSVILSVIIILVLHIATLRKIRHLYK
ncbi:MAG: protein kinase [Candidatus Aminicenantes bacterium]|nr:protein kinase [Candidatus Aminicenantes bacterium]